MGGKAHRLVGCCHVSGLVGGLRDMVRAVLDHIVHKLDAELDGLWGAANADLPREKKATNNVRRRPNHARRAHARGVSQGRDTTTTTTMRYHEACTLQGMPSGTF